MLHEDVEVIRGQTNDKNNSMDKPLGNLANSFANRSAPREAYCDLGLTDQSAESVGAIYFEIGPSDRAALFEAGSTLGMEALG